MRTIPAFDEEERADIRTATRWVNSGAPLYRTIAADHPPTHLVSYFLVTRADWSALLLVAHRKAGLWLPAGGHVEPGEHPWHTVARECGEELGIPATPTTLIGEQPFFLTVNAVDGGHPHTDVSLWYLLDAISEKIHWDPREFTTVRWWTTDQILAHPLRELDPNMHRFIGKLAAAIPRTPRPTV